MKVITTIVLTLIISASYAQPYIKYGANLSRHAGADLEFGYKKNEHAGSFNIQDGFATSKQVYAFKYGYLYKCVTFNTGLALINWRVNVGILAYKRLLFGAEYNSKPFNNSRWYAGAELIDRTLALKVGLKYNY